MVIRGNTRGNGPQLAQYLTGSEQNDQVQIVEVADRLNADSDYLHQTLEAMSLTAELTKSPKGLYHAQINPAYSEDRRMTADDWLQAADILGDQLGLTGQRRVVVLHTKKNRTHAHVVFERYNHQTGKVISNSFSRLAQDRARKEMERVFEHAPTPHRNTNRAALKEEMTKLWQDTTTGPDFIQSVYDNGYLIAAGVPRHPFMVVDDTGRSFDLVRQLDGIRIKEVRQRLRNVDLMPEKQAIEIMRDRQENGSDTASPPQQKADPTPTRAANDNVSNEMDTGVDQPSDKELTDQHRLMADFIQMGRDHTTEAGQDNGLEKKKKLANAFRETEQDLSVKAAEAVPAATVAPAANLAGDVPPSANDDTRQGDHSITAEQPVAQSAQTDEPISLEPHDGVGEAEPINTYGDTLRGFMQATDDLVLAPVPEQADQKRQQKTAHEFLANEDMTTPDTSEMDRALQRLILEQRESRDRIQKRGRKRTR